MIETVDLNKSFGEIHAVNSVSVSMKEREIFGLVGTNGAGKSTLLRMIAGVMRPDSGEVWMDGKPLTDDPDDKRNIFFIPNDFYYSPNSTGEDMARYFLELYPSFSMEHFQQWMKAFDLDGRRRISAFSKGMKKQLSLILGLSAGTKYLLCDETFDGLDPVMRRDFSSLIAGEMEDRGLTPVLTSHNLREIEDLCDHIGVLHKGGILLSQDLSDARTHFQKVQCVFSAGGDASALLNDEKISSHECRGRLMILTIRADRGEVISMFESVHTDYFEILPLSLEEIFISEVKAAGYSENIIIMN